MAPIQHTRVLCEKLQTPIFRPLIPVHRLPDRFARPAPHSFTRRFHGRSAHSTLLRVLCRRRCPRCSPFHLPSCRRRSPRSTLHFSRCSRPCCTRFGCQCRSRRRCCPFQYRCSCRYLWYRRVVVLFSITFCRPHFHLFSTLLSSKQTLVLRWCRR